MDNSFINNLSKRSKMKWSTISSKLLNTKKNELQYSLVNLGFEIYDTESKKVDLNKDGYIDETTNNIICNGETFNRVYRYIGEN